MMCLGFGKIRIVGRSKITSFVNFKQKLSDGINLQKKNFARKFFAREAVINKWCKTDFS